MKILFATIYLYIYCRRLHTLQQRMELVRVQDKDAIMQFNTLLSELQASESSFCDCEYLGHSHFQLEVLPKPKMKSRGSYFSVRRVCPIRLYTKQFLVVPLTNLQGITLSCCYLGVKGRNHCAPWGIKEIDTPRGVSTETDFIQ